MLSDFLHALRHGPDQLRYFRHTYSPLSPWRAAIAEVERTAASEAARYGIRAEVDRRRAYQVARMVVADRRGDHLVDLVPDAYLAYSPPSAAGFHAGKRAYGAPADRREAFRRHPQTLAFLLCPPALGRAGVGASVPGGVGPIAAAETLDVSAVASRIRERSGGKAPDGAARSWAETLVRLAAGVPDEKDPEGDAKAA